MYSRLTRLQSVLQNYYVPQNYLRFANLLFNELYRALQNQIAFWKLFWILQIYTEFYKIILPLQIYYLPNYIALCKNK